jgi:hypothetical protein
MDTDRKWASLDDSEFFRRLPVSGFTEYLKSGAGFFLARHPVEYVDATGHPKWNMIYLPIADSIPSFLAEAVEAARRYDPHESLVFVVYDGGSSLTVRVMGEKEMGAKPIDAFRAYLVKAGQGRLIPGEVVLLAEGLEVPGCVERGLYVFLTREGGWMTLRKAELDGNAAIQLTNVVVRVHCDFEECFSSSPGVVLRLYPVGQKKKRRGKGKA